MSEDQTESRARRKTQALIAGGALAGLVLRLSIGWAPKAAAENWLEFWTKLASSLGLKVAWFDLASGWLTSWASAPLIGAVLAATLAELRWTRAIIDQLIPDPPPFVRSDLKAERLRGLALFGPEAQPASFIGRDAELADLVAGFHAHGPFQWRFVLGPSGMGKTRLAIEWLAIYAEQKGWRRKWDIGVLDREPPLGWRARRPTTLVIDEPRDLPRLLSLLAAGAGPGRPVRVLVVNQQPMSAEPDDDFQARSKIQAARRETLTLTGLTAETLDTLWSSASSAAPPQHLAETAAGRPRAALLLARYPQADDQAQALALWCGALLPELKDTPDQNVVRPADRALLRTLALAALAGPLPIDQARTLSGSEFNRHLLERFFPNARLDQTLPALEPEDLAQEILLRALDFLEPPDRDSIAAAALEAAPETMEQRLGALWAERPETRAAIALWHGLPLDTATADIRRAACLVELQRTFDIARPEAAETALALTDPEEIAQATDRRPFDEALRSREGEAAITAANQYGSAKRFDDLERWARRLDHATSIAPFDRNADILLYEARLAVAATYYNGPARRFADLERSAARLDHTVSIHHRNPDILLEGAKAVVNAINSYGLARRFEDLERWATRLDHIVSIPPLDQSPDIRREEAKAVVNATNSYGLAGRSDDLERWGARLDRIIATRLFDENQGIRLEEAKAVVNAINSHGLARRFEDLERWGERLDRIIATRLFDQNPDILLEEAKAAVNATNGYSLAGRFDDLERWGERIDRIIATRLFDGSPSIRLQEAKAAVNAINGYGLARRFEDLERWATRLDHIVSTPPFDQNPQIRLEEVKAVVNATNRYGSARRYDDLERWGERLDRVIATRLFDQDPDIRLEEAKAAVNALTDLPAALHLERQNWLRRLARCARDFPIHPGIQRQANVCSVGFLSQAQMGWPYGQPKP